jgi:benzoate/toluate 1,2-dioxygenase beta subunit
LVPAAGRPRRIGGLSEAPGTSIRYLTRAIDEEQSMPVPAVDPIRYDALVQDERIHASLYTDPRIFDEYTEARLADEARYAEWEALWTDDGIYWVPATTDPDVDPDRQISHIYDNRQRIATRIKLLQTGYRLSQEPASLMRRLISNVEVDPVGNGELLAGSNFALAELSIQAKHETHWWVGRATHRLRRVDGALRMSQKKVVLINAAEPLPNLSFLI